jgi:hypothetical protein
MWTHDTPQRSKRHPAGFYKSLARQATAKIVIYPGEKKKKKKKRIDLNGGLSGRSAGLI